MGLSTWLLHRTRPTGCARAFTGGSTALEVGLAEVQHPVVPDGNAACASSSCRNLLCWRCAGLLVLLLLCCLLLLLLLTLLLSLLLLLFAAQTEALLPELPWLYPKLCLRIQYQRTPSWRAEGT